MTDIVISERTEGMVDASAGYYQESSIFKAIQNTQALEYDRIHGTDEELNLQLSPYTATWGLVYWEVSVGIIPNPTGDYKLRRPPILARMFNTSNFGVREIKAIAANYGEQVDVVIDISTYTVAITFYNGIPPFFREFNRIISERIHAHLGSKYKAIYKNRANVLLGARHIIASKIVALPYLVSNYDTAATIRVASYPTMTSNIVVHPYLLGRYDISTKIGVSSWLTTTSAMAVRPYLTDSYGTSTYTKLTAAAKTGGNLTVNAERGRLQ